MCSDGLSAPSLIGETPTRFFIEWCFLLTIVILRSFMNLDIIANQITLGVHGTNITNLFMIAYMYGIF